MESVIKWHVGEPKENGAYIATYKKPVNAMRL